MASFVYHLSKKSVNGKNEIIVRVAAKNVFYQSKTNIFIHPEIWDEKKKIVKKVKISNEFYEESIKIRNAIYKMEEKIELRYRECLGNPKTWLKDLLLNNIETSSFFEQYEKFIDRRNISESSLHLYRMLGKYLVKYEEYNNVEITFKSLNLDFLNDFEHFLKNVIGISENSTSAFINNLRTFIKEMYKFKIISENPFEFYLIKPQKYGSVTYITKEERDMLYLAPMPKELEEKRDMFIFQCHVGCRASDLLNITKKSIINGTLEYIAKKTSSDRPITIRVPLTKTAMEIYERYRNTPYDTLFKKTSIVYYNVVIKKIFKYAGLTRIITIRDKHTGKTSHVSLCDIASSHMARRTFIANLYKKVKDPNIIGKMSGHVDGSKAFSRYRDIDDELMKQTINLIE